ncbi:MAG: 23S rRNA (uracil(1939)-C(5))-methyltransferase RlmD, partial [Tissierellia bacterium]|nr:23S rRNA (uracil(1939)-C(5))-methyltransferase RlmD [Tissierellia bacterium]
FKISPLSFFQVNPVQTEILYKKALEYADLKGAETVIDAYCGIGTISLFLSQKAKKVYGVEIVGQAIEDAKENAKINGIENVEFILGESETVIPKLYEEGIRTDVIVVDPPRKGCDKKLLEVIAKMAPEKIVYVSCNPSTMARDLKYLTEKGYQVKEIQPVDQFPMTVHVESIILMTYCGSREG